MSVLFRRYLYFIHRNTITPRRDGSTERDAGSSSLSFAISVMGDLTFGLVDYPNQCHPDVVRQGHAGESDVGSSGIGADGATTPETLRHQDRLAGRSGERRVTASTEGDIRAARGGLISQVPRQMGTHWSASADSVHA